MYGSKVNQNKKRMMVFRYKNSINANSNQFDEFTLDFNHLDKWACVMCDKNIHYLNVVVLTGYSWDQPQRSQHTEGSKGFNIKTPRFPSVSVHWWMATFSISLLLFGQKLQDNTKESVTREREGSGVAVILTSGDETRWFCYLGIILALFSCVTQH